MRFLHYANVLLSDDNVTQENNSVLAIAGGAVLGAFLVIALGISLVVFYNKQRTRHIAENVEEIDENPTYGDCFDPYAEIEMVDINGDYWST